MNLIQTEHYAHIVETQLKDPERPTWIVLTPWSIAEAALFMSLAQAFIEMHGHSMTVVVPNVYDFIVKLYEHRFFKIVAAEQALLQNIARSGLIPQDRFELNSPMTASYRDTGFGFSRGLQYLSRYAGRGGMSDTDMMRFVLRVPWRARLERPVIPSDWVSQARELALQWDVKYKQSVVLFPIGDNQPILSDFFWKTLACRLINKGYKVFTCMIGANSSNSPAVTQIEGTIPLELPFHLALSFVNFAGRVITGVNDMQFLISLYGMQGTELTILLTVPSNMAENHFSQGHAADYPHIVAQSMQYTAPELYRPDLTHEFIVPYDAGEMELERCAHAVAEIDMDDSSHFNRYELNGKLFVDEHSDWLRCLYR